MQACFPSSTTHWPHCGGRGGVNGWLSCFESQVRARQGTIRQGGWWKARRLCVGQSARGEAKSLHAAVSFGGKTGRRAALELLVQSPWGKGRSGERASESWCCLIAPPPPHLHTCALETVPHTENDTSKNILVNESMFCFFLQKWQLSQFVKPNCDMICGKSVLV